MRGPLGRQPEPALRRSSRRIRHLSSPVVRFLGAYVLAAFAATVTVLIVQSIQVLSWGLGFEAFHDILPTAAIYAVYSLGFTLVLGLVGWLILHLLKWRGLPAYAGVGALLGAIAAGLFVTDGFDRDNPFLYSWPLAGVLAALTFRAVFYRGDHPRISRAAAA
jgi:ABC-type branched-subunit amino acid transport system permease subunit